jgi:hypothetical protein
VLDRFAGADSRAFAGTAARKEGAGARAGTDGGPGSGCCYHSARSDRGGHGEDDANCGTIRYVRPYDRPHHGQSLTEPFGFQPDGRVQLEQAD